MGTLAAAIHATVYRGGGDPSLIFDAPLLAATTTGKAVVSAPAFSRATGATVTSNGMVDLCLSGEARFSGARRECNYLFLADRKYAGPYLSAAASAGIGSTCENDENDQTKFISLNNSAADRVDVSAGNPNTYNFLGKTVTFSFFAKAGTTNRIRVRHYVNPWATFSDDYIDLTGDWRRYSFTGTVPTTAGLTTIGCLIYINPNAVGGNPYVYLKNPKYEVDTSIPGDSENRMLSCLGPELLTNPGGPFTSTDNWAAGSCTLSVENGCLKLTATSDVTNPGFQQIVTTEIGAWYFVQSYCSYRSVRNSNTMWTVRIGDTDWSSGVATGYDGGMVFQATSTQTRVGVHMGEAGIGKNKRMFYISLKKIDVVALGTHTPYAYYSLLTNGNTVNSNVVTEASGSPIAASSLKGYLSEDTKTNLYINSENLTPGSYPNWQIARASVVTNQTASPSGSVTADKLNDSTDAAATHYIYQPMSFTPAGSTPYTFSGYFKAGELSKILIQFASTNGAWNNESLRVDLSAGTATVYSGSFNSYGIESVGNGWYRVYCSATTQAAPTAYGNVPVYLADASFSTAFTGTGSQGIFMWGIQLEEGLTASSYIPTTSAVVQRLTDVLEYDVSNFSPSEGAYQVEWSPFVKMPAVAGGSNILGNLAGGSGNRWLYDGAGANNVATYDGTTDLFRNTVSNGPGEAPRTYTIRASYSAAGNSRRLAFAGYSSTSGNHVAFDVSGAGARLSILPQPHISSAIKNIKLYNSPKSQAWVEAA